ncbi:MULTISPECIES: hypothetical protein [unclassified Ruegeria]|uniref:hypothetical protein n=1 Tax=unclassified Ruegeria TaxID=2625375 RepID=UPI0014931EE1|nr:MULTISPECIES: hypothetical protein [unclassified Ruegeria]NOD87425.1 hypothetical protein [Ruegeria sp. HKCCD4318]NOE12980.1 hypothetical protein [Ruegeria sp. HKCCD4318-2]NOG08853.1 hypothetical protein [Ruegeria sp. HKCCD4315]
MAKLGSKLARRALIMDIVPDIVEKGRAFHINTVSAGYSLHQARGQFQADDEVAQIVDHRLNKPVQSVRFGGNITFIENPANLRWVAEATAFVFDHAFQSSRLYREGTPPYVHMGGWEVRVDGRAISPSAILSYAEKDGWERMDVTNTVPYASKLESLYGGFDHLLYGAWKKARSKGWHQRVDMVFATYAQDYSAADGGRVRRPNIRIQRLGALGGSRRGRIDK